MLGIWYRDIWGFATHAVIPYDERMARFPAYLQQLEMESNGKSVDLSGMRARHETAPVVFGEPGTNGQHAFFQMLHQGTEIVPIDFLVAARPCDADTAHHHLLFANCLAQSQALMQGRSIEEVKETLKAQKLSPEAIEALAPHKVFEGNRPSSTFLYKKLSPRVLGQLIALYEHKVFVQGVDLEYQFLRSMGRRTRQGTRQQAHADRRRCGPLDGRARRVDRGPRQGGARLSRGVSEALILIASRRSAGLSPRFGFARRL